MIKKTISYVDYNGVERTEDFFFNLNESELVEMELTSGGGLEVVLDKIIKAKDAEQIIKWFKKIIAMSYGVKSDDGRRFIKNPEVFDEFRQTEAYNKLFMELATDEKAGAEFVNGIVPRDLTPADQPAIAPLA